MDNTQTITTKNAEETQNFGEKLAASLIQRRKEGTDTPHVVCLYGELGAGKTVLTQGFAKGLGLPSRLVSPTFIIVKRYTLKKDTQYFYHVDLYRLQKMEDIYGLGLKEIFDDKNEIVVVEWAERLGELTPDKRIDIRLTTTDENKRNIEIQYVR